MPLFPRDVLAFVNEQHDICDVFEQISLVARGVATLSSTNVPHDSVGVPSPEADDMERGVWVISTGTASSCARSSQKLQRSSSPSRPLSCTVTPARGTMYVCDIPEYLWNSIDDSTATSTQLPPCLAPSADSPAVDDLRDLIGERNADVSVCSAQVSEPLPFSSSSPRRVVSQQYYARPMEEEELRRPSSYDESLSILLRGADCAGAPEGMQSSSDDPTATSTQLPPCLAPSADSPAVDDLRDLIGERNADVSVCSAQVSEPLPFSSSSPRRVVSQQYYARPMEEEELRRPSSYDESLSILLRGADCAGAPERNTSFKHFSPPEHPATSLPASSHMLQTSHRDSEKVFGASKTGCGGLTMSPTSLRLPMDSPTGEGAADAAVNAMGRTVTVVVWVCADAASAAAVKGVCDSTEPAPVGSLFAEAASTRSTVAVRHRDAQHFCFTSPICHKPLTASGMTGEGGPDMGSDITTLPSFLCFALRQIDELESLDTDLLTPRERRVQVLRLQLKTGATVYAANKLSDVLVRVEPTCSPAGDSTAPVAVKGNKGKALSSDRSALCNSLLLMFHQGGITRCVTALRRHSPGLSYLFSPNRNSSSSLVVLADASQPACADVSATFPLSPSGAGAANPSGSSGIRAVAHEGNRLLRTLPLLRSKMSSATDAALQRQPKDESRGWRQRLSTAVLFRRSSPRVGDRLAHHPVTVNRGEVSAFTSHPPFVSVGLVSQVPRLRQGADHIGDSRGQGGRPAVDGSSVDTSLTSPPDGYQRASSYSSFEDLADEMTARRLGSGYAPPHPSLSRGEGSRGAGESFPLTKADWMGVFDDPSEGLHHTRQHGSTLGNPSTDDVTDTVVPPQARRLNADRWRAFRRAVYERGGLADESIRFEVWCYLLDAFAVGNTESENANVLRKEELLYDRLTTQWKSFLPEQEENCSLYRGAKRAILKDVERTDRTQPAFSDDDSDMLRVLREILLAHVMLNMDLGYSQGMSDVAAVALLVTSQWLPPASYPSTVSESAMFLCYRSMLSKHMAANFLIEERKARASYATVSGLQCKLYEAQVLTRHFHPALYTHLTKVCMADDMLFCFRWLLVSFKRDLPSVADTMRFWDVLFACPYTSSYDVIVMVAVLGELATQIITHIQTYDTLLRFANMLSCGTTVDEILVCARRFYEQVCAPETREVRRRVRRKATESAAGCDVRVRDPGWRASPNSMAASTVARASAGRLGDSDADTTDFPCVKEMVQLFLETDGPL